MNELVTLAAFGPFTITAYGLCIALGALLAALLTVALGRSRVGADCALSLCVSALLGALLGGRALYCLTMLETILVDLDASFLPQLWQGGYTLYGAVLGGAAGAWLYARAAHRDARPLLDLLAPGAALTLTVARLAEYFTSQGLGDYIVDEAMMRFPFAVPSVYEDYQIPVFLYEALAAAVILVITLRVLRAARPGRTAETFIILLGVTQVILESLREDEFIRFGFVRLNQLAAAFTMAAVLAARVKRCVKDHGWSGWQIGRIVLFLASVGGVILLEFALDKSSIDNVILYAVMAGTLAVMAVSLLRDGRAGA